MAQRTHNPFVLRHPISLGDAIASLFRAKPTSVPLKVEQEVQAARAGTKMVGSAPLTEAEDRETEEAAAGVNR